MARITNIDALLFPVELRPLFTEIKIHGKNLKIEVPNNKIVVNRQTGNPIGVVSSNYRLITNQEAINLGKKCLRGLFGSEEADNIEVFKVDAPSTGSYCHIDLIHKNYVMNLWDEKKHSDIYIPYIRITNSYNTTRALRFDVGFCRKVCLNGVIFESETIKFTFSHVKYELDKDILFLFQQNKISKLFKKFATYTRKLKDFQIRYEQSMRLITSLFNIKKEKEIDFSNKKEDKAEYKLLIDEIEKKLKFYIGELGSNGYSLFNVITDMASHPIKNRYFRRDMNSMQRLAGNWINSFQEEIKKPSFDIEKYLKKLEKPHSKALYLTSNRYAATVR